MNCYLSGVLGIAMLGATFFTMCVSREQQDNLHKVLSAELAKRYECIIAERRNHYMLGLLFGLALSYAIVPKTGITNLFHRISLYLAITLITSVVVYSALPKSDYMLNHLRSEKENRAWLEVYKTMKHRYFFGFLLGSLTAIPVAYSLC